MRADAQRNHDRMVAAAAEVVAEQGADASLEEIEQEGRGRIGDSAPAFRWAGRAARGGLREQHRGRLCTRRGPPVITRNPCRRLTIWLHGMVGHIATRPRSRPGVDAERRPWFAMSPPDPLAGRRLLERGLRRTARCRSTWRSGDLLKLVNGISLASDEDTAQAGRCSTLAIRGVASSCGLIDFAANPTGRWLEVCCAHHAGRAARADRVLDRSGLPHRAAYEHRGRRRNAEPGHRPAGARSRAVAGRLRRAARAARRRAGTARTRTGCSPHPVPGDPQAGPGQPAGAVPGQPEALGIDIARARRPLRRGQLGAPGARRVGPGLGGLAGRPGDHPVHVLPAGRRHDAGPGVGGDHLRHRADHDGAAGRLALQGHRLRARASRTARCSARPSTRCAATTSTTRTSRPDQRLFEEYADEAAG